MARLIARINTNRNAQRSPWYFAHRPQVSRDEQVHRLGDQWVTAEAATWDIAVQVKMQDSGSFEVLATDLTTGGQYVLARGSVGALFGRIPPKRRANGTIIPEKPKKPKKPPKKRLTAKEKRELQLVDSLFQLLDKEEASA